jgi:branched-subunit amino acid transport protein
MTTWATIFGMALVTLLTRAAPLVLLRSEPPAWVRRWLSGVPVAVFTALALRPLVLTAAPDPHLTFGAPLLAGVVGALVAWRSGNVLATIVAGLAAYWALRAFGIN